MILSEERLEQLVCDQLSINPKKSYRFMGKYGLIWAASSYEALEGENFNSLWYGKVEQAQQTYCFVCLIESDKVIVVPEGLLDYGKTLETQGVFMNNQYFCLIVGTDGKQRIIPKRNLSWDSVRRDHYYGGDDIPKKGNLVYAQKQGKKFLAWLYYDDKDLCSFFNIEDSQWLKPSDVSEWSFAGRGEFLLGNIRFRCEDRCIEKV